MAEPFFRETRAVQKRTVFGDAPCLKLSVDGYTYSSPAFVYVSTGRQYRRGNGDGIKTAVMRKHNGKNRMEGMIDV